MTTATCTETRTASDIMSKDVVTASPTDTLQDALTVLVDHHVTGLPVVDHRDRCVAVISMSDILDYERDHSSETADGIGRCFNPDSGRWEEVGLSDFALERTGQVAVSEVMSADLVFVRPDTPVDEVATAMLKSRIHRILVLDEEWSLLGIISSFDFVRLASDT